MTYSLNGCIELQKEQEKSFVDSTNLGSILSTLKATFDKNLALISLKKKEPSRVIALTKTADVIGAFNDELAKANSSISEHNNLIDNLESEKSILKKEILKFFAAEYDSVIAKHLRAINGIKCAIENLKRKIDETAVRCKVISSEISKLENSITSITPTVNEINRLLKGYGFTNFKIQEVKDNKNYYQVVRENGEPAKNTLSEGETTFITFLYYMQVVKGSFQTDGITKDRVLVIDDPVSSLDSNVLFIVSSLLREVFNEIHEGKGSVKQVMILTHNVYFHKEITFSNRSCKWKGNVKYWILRKRDNQTSIQDYGKINPIKSSYELMWTELKNKSQHSCIAVQNIMRRIIEYYFSILGGVDSDKILERFDNHEERIICKSLLSWVNGGSHSLPDDLYVEMSEDKLDRNMNVFKEIFHRMGQGAHYEMMMQMCDKENKM